MGERGRDIERKICVLIFSTTFVRNISQSKNNSGTYNKFKWYYNKVRELANVCLPWQHWTKALVWFDDFDISAFHNCVVVDL